MKWFKHMSASWDDEKLARLVGSGGMEGLAMYGLYWRLLEIVAAQMEGKSPSCSCHYPVTRWSLLLSLRGSLVFSTLSRLAVTGVVTVQRDELGIIVTIPNLLKYRDEYARKSGHAPDNVPPRTEAEGEGEVEQKQKEKKPFASTANAVPASDVKILGTLPLNDGTDWPVTAPFADEMQKLYQGVDVRQELRSMKGWLIGNPTLRKTKRGVKRFITSWLEREQDKPKQTGGTTNGKPTRTENIIQTSNGAREILRARRMDSAAHSDDGADNQGTSTGRIIEGEVDRTVAPNPSFDW